MNVDRAIDGLLDVLSPPAEQRQELGQKMLLGAAFAVMQAAPPPEGFGFGETKEEMEQGIENLRIYLAENKAAQEAVATYFNKMRTEVYEKLSSEQQKQLDRAYADAGIQPE